MIHSSFPSISDLLLQFHSCPTGIPTKPLRTWIWTFLHLALLCCRWNPLMSRDVRDLYRVSFSFFFLFAISNFLFFIICSAFTASSSTLSSQAKIDLWFRSNSSWDAIQKYLGFWLSGLAIVLCFVLDSFMKGFSSDYKMLGSIRMFSHHFPLFFFFFFIKDYHRFIMFICIIILVRICI